MDIIVDILYFLVFPNLIFYFYSRYNRVRFRWYLGLFYTIPYILLTWSELYGLFFGLALLALNVLTLTIFGICFFKKAAAQAFLVSAVVLSVFYLTSGFTLSIEYFIAGQLSPEQAGILKYLDTYRCISAFVLLAAAYLLLYRLFSDCLLTLQSAAVSLLSVPLLFIAYVEQTLASSIYGDTVIWNTSTGLTYPTVNDAALLTLHLTAYAGMCASLLTFRKMMRAIQQEQMLQALKQQALIQSTYVRESQTRYEQTRAFRHDIKNHFIVLKELLANADTDKASSYLSALDDISSTLSYPVHTNNSFVDALLGSKLMIARQQDINITCDLTIPSDTCVLDLDWCILLANTLDNAMEAVSKLPIPARYICIYGNAKGNLYHLHIENSCQKDIPYPKYGIGLSNIKAVTDRLHGTLDIQVDTSIFKMDILLFISQP